MDRDSPFRTPEAQELPDSSERLDLDSLRTRAAVASISIVATGVLGLLLTAMGALGAGGAEDDPSTVYIVLGAALGLTAVTGIVSFLVWLRRAAANARALSPGVPFAYSLGWTIGWWFVPFLNLWRPLQVVHEIWQRSEGRPDSGAAHDWGRNAPPLLNAWWVAWISSNMLERVASRQEGLALESVAAVASLVGAVLCARVIGHIGQAQEATARAAEPGGPV